MSTTGRERGGYAKGRERRDAILAAANEVFATRGFRGASLATIAKRVGMSEPGLLHHFASKEELLLELLKLRDQHDDERIAAGARRARARPGRPARAVPPERGAARHRAPLHHPRRGERRRRPPRPRLVPRALPRAPRASSSTGSPTSSARAASTPTSTPRCVASQILAMFDGLQIQWLLDPDGVDMVGGVRGLPRAVAAALSGRPPARAARARRYSIIEGGVSRAAPRRARTAWDRSSVSGSNPIAVRARGRPRASRPTAHPSPR